MARRSQSTLTPLETLQLIALSLATPELKRGLDLMVTISIDVATDIGELPWSGMSDLGYDPYDEACIKAAHAWVKRVTAINYDVKFARPRDEPDIDQVEEG